MDTADTPARGTWLPITAVVMLVPIVAAAVHLCFFNDSWRRRFGVVKEGVLLRSEQPSLSELDRVKRRYAIRTIINLLTVDEAKDHPDARAEKEYAARNGIRYIHIPMSIPRPEDIREFLAIIQNREAAPVLLHCKHGTARTGMLVAAYRIEREGWSNQDALDEMADYGFDLHETRHQEMIDFVVNYRPATPAKPDAIPTPDPETQKDG